MVHKRCLICCGECSSMKIGTQEANSTSFPSVEDFNRQQAEGKDNGDTELQILFLLRKLLEIPESTCCLLRERFRNASVWIECCDSCLDLVEKCKAALEQAELFQKQYEELRSSIKTTMLKSQKTFISESKCEVIVRSHLIIQETDNYININTTVTGTDEEIFPDVNVRLTVPVLFEKINIVKSEEDDITISFNENDGMDCNFEPTDFVNRNSEQEQNKSNFETIQSDNPRKSANDNNLDEDVSAKRNKSPQGNQPSKNMKGEKKPSFGKCDDKSNAEKKHECHTCLKLFRLPHQLRCHLRSHFSTAKKSVSQMKENFKKHLMKRATGQNLKCSICGKGFPFACYLKRHSMRHSGEKPFECDVCGKAFVRHDELKSHQLTHSEKKLFKCDICDKSFKWKCNLTQHHKKHDEETPK